MEERVGLWWHRLVSRAAQQGHAAARVELASMTAELGLLFRALGGAHGLALSASASKRHGARRALVQRLAGAGDRFDPAWADAQALRLPESIELYPSAELNRGLFRWLAALCAVLPLDGSWAGRNQQASAFLLDNFRGLAATYRELLAAELQRRPDPARLPADEARLEVAIRRALAAPGSVAELPSARRPPQPVPLWASDVRAALQKPGTTAAADDAPAPSQPALQQDRKRRAATDSEEAARSGGLLVFRPESIFSWTEYAPVDHEIQDNDDADLARAADDLDTLSLARSQRSAARRLRMDLDLAARAEAPPTQAAAAIRVPEWNHKTRSLLPDHCSIRVQPPAEAHNAPFPQRLRADQRRLQRQMAALRNDRRRLYGQSDGDEIDVDACIRQRSAPQAGRADFYRATQRNERDIACLLLADLSLSTEAAVDGELRVIDVIKDSLQLFAETLSISRDRLALYGFNSRQRHDVRMIEIKSFDAACDAQVRGRIEGLAASAYTRMGPVVRHASALLARQPSRQQILLLLSDGKPNDNDYYEGRYGIEDTRHALAAARRSGQHTFCVTIDRDAGEYLPHLFGRHGYTIVNRPSELPQRLALLYARMTRESR